MRIKVPEKFDFLFEPIRYKGAHGGRASAKSHSFATAAVITGTKKRMVPGYAKPKAPIFLCCREIQNSIKDSVKKLLEMKIEQLEDIRAIPRGFYYPTLTEIRGDNGAQFQFEGLRSNVESIKSKEGVDFCWVSEARSVSKNSLDTLIPTIRDPRSELWFDWNPKFKNDPIDVMLRGSEPPPLLPELAKHYKKWMEVRKINWWDNPFFPELMRQEMEWDRARDVDKYNWVWLGEYLQNSEARVFQNWKVEPFDTPDDVRFYLGADWGYSVDPTVLVRCYLSRRTLYIDQEVYRIGCEIEDTPALFKQIPEAEKWPMIADNARPETISYVRRHGFPKIVAAKKGKGSVEDGISFVKNYNIVVHPRCIHTIDELSTYSWKRDKLTDEILPVLEDDNNNVIDAVRYAVENVRRNSYGMMEAV